jgi:hypothetical protein
MLSLTSEQSSLRGWCRPARCRREGCPGSSGAEQRASRCRPSDHRQCRGATRLGRRRSPSLGWTRVDARLDCRGRAGLRPAELETKPTKTTVPGPPLASCPSSVATHLSGTRRTRRCRPSGCTASRASTGKPAGQRAVTLRAEQPDTSEACHAHGCKQARLRCTWSCAHGRPGKLSR